MKIIMPLASFSVLLPDDSSVSCNDLLSAQKLCAFLDMQDDSITYKPVVSYTVTLPNSRHMPCKDLHSAEMLCAYLNGLNTSAEPNKDNTDEHYDRVVGNLVRQMPGGSTLTHNNSGGWRYRHADGVEYGPYVNVHHALEVLSEP